MPKSVWDQGVADGQVSRARDANHPIACQGFVFGEGGIYAGPSNDSRPRDATNGVRYLTRTFVGVLFGRAFGTDATAKLAALDTGEIVETVANRYWIPEATK